jgi:hypothetical protein
MSVYPGFNEPARKRLRAFRQPKRPVLRPEYEMDLVEAIRETQKDATWFDEHHIAGEGMINSRLAKALDLAVPSARYRSNRRCAAFKSSVIKRALEQIGLRHFEMLSGGAWKVP